MLSAWFFSRTHFVPVYTAYAPTRGLKKQLCHKNEISDVQYKLPLISLKAQIKCLPVAQQMVSQIKMELDLRAGVNVLMS